MKKAKYFYCTECEYLQTCKRGQNNTKGYNGNIQSFSNVGCYNHEGKKKQLKLAL